MRNSISLVWHGFKVAISIVTFLMGALFLLLASYSGELSTPLPWVAFAGLTFVATTPWIFGSPPGSARTIALAGIFMGIGILFFAFGMEHVPQDCSDSERRRLLCYFLNWLHAKGGQNAVTTFWAITGALCLAGSTKFFLKRKQHAHNKQL